MSVAYEPRSFMSEGAYPSMGDDHDPPEQRFTDSDVAEQLSHYTQEASMLPDERDVLGDERDLLHDDPDPTHMDDGTQLDLTADSFPSPMEEVSIAPPLPQLQEMVSVTKVESPRSEGSPSMRPKGIPKPERDVSKQDDGKFHCPLSDCREETRVFSRKCEWK